MSDSLIIRAAKFSAEAHADQKRKYNGMPYIVHPGRVAAAASIHQIATPGVVAAAWLHDVLEDCPAHCERLVAEFPGDVVELVRELTNPSKDSKAIRAERKQMDREHIASASHEAKVLKLLDRLDNMREMDPSQAGKFAVLYASETLALLEVIRHADLSIADQVRVICSRILLTQGSTP